MSKKDNLKNAKITDEVVDKTKNEEKQETTDEMPEEKNKKHMKHKLLKITSIIISIVLVLLIVLVSTYIIYDKKNEEKLSQRKLELEAVFIGTDKELEYGTEIKIEDLEKELFSLDKIQSINNYKLQINNEEQQTDNTYKFMQINDNKIKCTIYEVDSSKKVLNINIDNSSFLNFFKNFTIKYEPQEIELEKEYNYKVIDTQKPIIEGVADKEIFKGDDIDLKAGISAKDPVDGELEVSIEGEVKKDEVGEYPIKVKAIDKNSNESTAEFKVNVKEKPIANIPKPTNTNQAGSKKPSGNSGSSGFSSSGSSIPTYTVMSSLETEMFNITNQYRTEAGLQALRWDANLADIARKRTLATAHLGAEYYGWGHFATEYSDIFTHLMNSGVSFSNANENIAWNYSTKAAVKWLYNSPLHHAAMMGDYDTTGCGVCKGPDGEYLYFQVFVKK